MQIDRFESNARYLAALRLGVTIAALLLLAGSVLLVRLMDDRDAAPVITLASTILGWVVTLILAKPSE